jgi:hypothetical protein
MTTTVRARWITAADVKAGQLVHLPYAGKDLAVWDTGSDGDVILFRGSAADPRKPGHRTEVHGVRYPPSSPVRLLRDVEEH